MKSIAYLTLTGFLLLEVACFAQDTSSTYDRRIAELEKQVQALTENSKKKDKQFGLFKSGKSKFMLRGYFHSGFEGVIADEGSEYNFAGGGIAPILMYKQSDRLFFEAEFEGGFSADGEFIWGMEYADMSVVINKYLTVRGGKFLVPFGTFMEKLHPAWINKMATRPLGFGHDGIAPTSDVGLELRGAFNIGPTKWNYQAYVINGPQLKIGEDEPEEAGMLKFDFLKDNNPDKAVGGRIGFFPLSNSSLELGISGMTAGVGDKDSPYEKVRASLFAVDLNYVRSLNFMKSVIDIKGQYNYSQVSDANYAVPNDTTDLFYDFNNVSSSYYAQVSLKPALVQNKFVRRLEFVGRYSGMQTPEGSLWEQKADQWAVGINFWLDWRTVLKFGYQNSSGSTGGDDHGQEKSVGHDSGGSGSQHMFYLHWAMGF